MDPQAAVHLDAFVRFFVRKHRRPRWRTILAMKPAKWVGVSAYDCSEPEVADWNAPLLDALTQVGLAPHLDDPAYVFPIGHAAGDAPWLGSLRSALLSDSRVLECVVSLVPGSLAICYGHSNEVRFCRR
jgi:hypothetical protein